MRSTVEAQRQIFILIYSAVIDQFPNHERSCKTKDNLRQKYFESCRQNFKKIAKKFSYFKTIFKIHTKYKYLTYQSITNAVVSKSNPTSSFLTLKNEKVDCKIPPSNGQSVTNLYSFIWSSCNVHLNVYISHLFPAISIY